MKIYAYFAAAAAALALLAGTHWKAYRMGSNSVRVEWQSAEASRKEAERQALHQRFRENEITYRQQQETATKEGKRHAEELQAIKRRHAADLSKRVPIDPAKFCGRVATGTEAATPGSDGQTDAGAAFLPESLTRDLQELAADADEVAADLRTLKERAAACFAGS